VNENGQPVFQHESFKSYHDSAVLYKSIASSSHASALPQRYLKMRCLIHHNKTPLHLSGCIRPEKFFIGPDGELRAALSADNFELSADLPGKTPKPMQAFIPTFCTLLLLTLSWSVVPRALNSGGISRALFPPYCVARQSRLRAVALRRAEARSFGYASSSRPCLLASSLAGRLSGGKITSRYSPLI